MPYKFNGTLKKVFPSTSGISRNSGKEWTRKCALFSAEEIKYGNHTQLDVYVSAWNKDCILLSETCEGKECEVTCRVESKEYNGRWTTDLYLERIVFNDLFGPNEASPGQPEDLPPSPYPKATDDDLPF